MQKSNRIAMKGRISAKKDATIYLHQTRIGHLRQPGQREAWHVPGRSSMKKEGRDQIPGPCVTSGMKEKMVEMRGFEPLASALRTRRSPN